MYKYQEALDYLKTDVCEQDGGDFTCDECVVKKLCPYYSHCQTLQELIDQNKSLTLEECIKEWEERGWKVEIGEGNIQIHYTKFGRLSEIHIYKGMKTVRLFYENLHYEEFHLLSKTLKALEEE